MEKFKLKVCFVGLDTIKSKDGKIYNIICCLRDSHIIKVFDFNNTYQTILAENGVKKFDDINLVCEPYISNDSKLGVKIVNVEI